MKLNDGGNLRSAVNAEGGYAITRKKADYLEGFDNSRNGVTFNNAESKVIFEVSFWPSSRQVAM